MGVLKVRVNGAWEEVVPVPDPPLDEVWTGTGPPDPINNEVDLWTDTSTDPPVLKYKNQIGQWLPVSAAAADEVFISPDEPTDPAVELWYDPDAVRPPTLEEEVYVGAVDPDIVAPLNTVDLWFDPDDPTVTSGVPIGGTTGQALTKIDDVDANTEWSGPFVASALIRSHHIYGPITTSGWTWTLKAGTYLSLFQVSAVATVAGLRYCNLNMDGAQVAQSKHWFNAVTQHHQMNCGVNVLTIPTDGDYVFDITQSASVAMDANDFGHFTIIPAMPGAVI